MGTSGRCKNHAFRAVRRWRRAGSDPYGHTAALQKPRVARGTAVAAGRIRPSINYGQPAALQKPCVPCSMAVAAGGVRPLWTPRGTARTLRFAQHGGGSGQGPTLMGTHGGPDQLTLCQTGHEASKGGGISASEAIPAPKKSAQKNPRKKSAHEIRQQIC